MKLQVGKKNVGETRNILDLACSWENPPVARDRAKAPRGLWKTAGKSASEELCISYAP